MLSASSFCIIFPSAFCVLSFGGVLTANFAYFPDKFFRGDVFLNQQLNNFRPDLGQNETTPSVVTTEDCSASVGSLGSACFSSWCNSQVSIANYTISDDVLQAQSDALNLGGWKQRRDSSVATARVLKEIDSRLCSNLKSAGLKCLGFPALANGTLPGSRAVRMRNCATYLRFSGPSPDNLHLSRANFCRDRLCPQCNKRRSLKVFAQTSAIMDVLQRDFPDYRYLFLTLTVRNCTSDELPKTLDLLYSGWRNFYHESGLFRSYYRSKRPPVFQGSFRALEVKLGRDDVSWHPHLHVILAVKSDYFSGQSYLSARDFVALWRKACRLDYDPVCWVERVMGSADDSGRVSYRDAVAEVSKYPVKSDDYLSGDIDTDVSRVETLLKSISYRRLCAYTGCFAKVRRQLGLDDAIDGDLVDVDGTLRSDVAELVYHAFWRSGFYRVASDAEFRSGSWLPLVRSNKAD